jgi:hypothetical protein
MFPTTAPKPDAVRQRIRARCAPGASMVLATSTASAEAKLLAQAVRHAGAGLLHSPPQPWRGYGHEADTKPAARMSNNGEREGFEPSMEFDPHTRLAGECLQPLGHLSPRLGKPA